MLLEQLDNALNKVPNAGKYYKNPSEKTVFLNLVNLQLFKEIAGPVNEYQLGRPVPSKNFQETSTEYALLSPFYKTGLLSSTVTTNIGTSVWDCNTLLDVGRQIYDVKVLLARYTDQESSVKVLPDNQFQTRVNSELVPPSEIVPIGSYYPDFKFQILPLPTTVAVKYLVTPLPCNIVYTDGAFDPEASTDLEWGEDAFTSLFTRAMQYMGINVANAAFFQEGTQLANRVV